MARAREAHITKRRFGRTDLHVSEFGLGCARIGGIFKRKPADFINLLSAALDAGINFFDTADIYSQGESEKLLARAFRRRRDDVIIASKAGYVLPSQRMMVARIKPLVRPLIRLLRVSRKHLPSAVRGEMAQDFSPQYLRRAIEGSLRRLRTDRIDLFQLHSPATSVVEAGDWIEALEALTREGKIRYYGVSCDAVDPARAALQHAGVASLQLPINLLERDALQVLPRAREQGVGVIARECLANGLLVKDVSTLDLSTYTRSEEEARSKAARIARYQQAAAEHGCTVTQMALQYVSRLDGVSVSLIGVSSLEQLDALLSAGLTPSKDFDLEPLLRLA